MKENVPKLNHVDAGLLQVISAGVGAGARVQMDEVTGLFSMPSAFRETAENWYSVFGVRPALAHASVFWTHPESVDSVVFESLMPDEPSVRLVNVPEAFTDRPFADTVSTAMPATCSISVRAATGEV